MFDLSISPENQAIADVVAAVAVDRLDGAAREVEAAALVPAPIWSALFELGLTSPIDEAHGGGGVPDPVSQLIAIEGLAAGDPGIAAAVAWSGQAALAIGRCGTAAQRSHWLPTLGADPNVRAACAVYEGFGRAPSESATSITAEGSGWRVRGTKVAVAFAEEANPLVVIGVDPDDGRLRAVVLGPDNLGVRRTTPVGRLALAAARLGTVDIDTVVDEAALLGGPDADAGALARVVSQLRLTTGALALGAARRATDYASQYARERMAFGKPIAAFQGVSFMMAEARMQIEASRLELWHVATRLDSAPIGELERSVSTAVNYATAIAMGVTRDAVQVLGGHGFIEDHPVERWYRSTAVLGSIDFDPTCIPFAASL